ncbi:MAG: replication-relaxation family protein [Planctomycetaceae bacterium]|nr:replication-relaxation family protein [Planctomycetales bacterium]MCB9924519.1 replication-relaxation family protein [Planctomycetaceae bacterium]
MNLTERDYCILSKVVTYYVLSRQQIQHLCFPSDKTGRVTRRRLQVLVSSGLLNRHRAEVIYPNSSPAGSVYYPSPKGIELLAEHTGDECLLLTPTQPPIAHHVAHWLAVSDTHIKLAAAIASQERVILEGFINEWDIVNKDAKEPENRFRLYTLLTDSPKLVCAPDAAFMLTVPVKSDDSTVTFSKVFYLEEDRSTSGANQVAASKCKGYAALAENNFHVKHFPATNVQAFTVLCIAPNARRREALRKAFKGKVGSELWRFASADELAAETFLHEPLWYPVTGEAMPLVKPEAVQ